VSPRAAAALTNVTIAGDVAASLAVAPDASSEMETQGVSTSGLSVKALNSSISEHVILTRADAARGHVPIG
jgi:hypothetical protein